MVYIKLVATIISALSTFGAERLGDSMNNQTVIIETNADNENSTSKPTALSTLFLFSQSEYLL